MNEFPEGEAPAMVAVSQAADLRDVLRLFGVAGGGYLGGGASSYSGGYTAGARMRDTPELQNPQRQEAWVFASIDIGAFAVSMVRERIYDGDPTDANTKEVTSGPVVDLLAKPNERVDSAFLRVCDFQNEVFSGESFWFLEGKEGEPVGFLGEGGASRIDLPRAIWPVSGSHVRLLPNKEQTAPKAWEAPTAAGKRIPFPDESVLQFIHRPDDERAWRGIGPMAVVWGYALQNHLARRFSSNILRNDGRVGGLLIVGGFMSPGQRRKLDREVEDRWNGPENAGKVRTLEGGDAKFQETNRTPRDLEWGELLRMNKEEIAAVLQTPGALLGLDTANYATFAGHLKRYVNLRIKPWLAKRARLMNSRFFPRLRGPGLSRLRVGYDIEELEKIIGNIEAASETVRKLVQAGVPLDSALMQAGVKTDPIPGGQVAMVNTSQVPLESAQARGFALALKAQAEAASALMKAGVEGQEALNLAGIVATYQEPEPEEEPDDDGGDDPKDGGKALAPPPPPPAPAGSSSTVRATSEQLEAGRASWARLATLRRPRVRDAERGLRSVLFRMRKAQLEALAEYARTGATPEKGVALYPGRTPLIPKASADSLLVALELDETEGLELEIGDEPQIGEELALAGGTKFCTTCSGKLVVVEQPRRLHALGWAATHLRLASVHPLERLADVARIQRAGISEAEIDNLIVAAQEAWRSAMAAQLSPVVETAYTSAAEFTAAEWGGAALTSENPEILQALADRAVRVVEGTQSELARRIRSALIRVLTDKDGILGGGASLQRAIEQALKECKAGTTAAFRTHSARALTIARTEVGAATSLAQFREIQAGFAEGILKAYSWITSGRGPEPEGNVRQSHFQLEGVVSTPDQGFVSPISGARAFHPHGFGVAAEDINCVCGLLGIVAD